jgi:hypothetical protein
MPPTHYSLRYLAFALGISVETLKTLLRDTDGHYKPFTITSRNGKERSIDNPSPELKYAQRSIRRVFLAPLSLPPFVHGGVKDRSQRTHVQAHLRKPNVASIDIKDFYPKTTNRQVYDVLAERLQLGPKLTKALTRLVTRNGHLPQGAPTSDCVGNLVLGPTDAQVEAIARELSLEPGRYVDGYDLSGERTREAIGRVIAALAQQGFKVRHRKTFNASLSKPQVVTGQTVNAGRPSLPKQHRDKVRAACHELIRAHRAGKPTLKLRQQVRGRLAYLAETNPGTAKRLLRELAAARVRL